MKIASSQQRKIVYALGILVLFGALVPYSQWLEKIQKEQELGEATIGQVDTGSFMLKLAMLGGFRGVVVNMLWTRSIDMQKAHDWDRLKSTVDMITKLQPHFLAIWTYQSWNLAYNVSVEWDAPEDKYEWIKEGIKFVQEGVSKNEKSPDLVWDTAWYYYHKLGFSDEAVILRRLFFDDLDDGFKKNQEGIVRSDNFELSGDWFKRSVRMVDSGEAGPRIATGMENSIEYVDAPVQHKGRPGDLHFRTMTAHSATRYAAALEKESMRGKPARFGAKAREAWELAEKEWVDFGIFEFPAPNTDEKIRLGVYDSPEEMEKLSDNQKHWVRRWGDQTSYLYWLDRSRAEMEPDGVESRRLFYEGTKALKAANFPEAAQQYQKGLELWAKLLKRHPNYAEDYMNKRDTGIVVKRMFERQERRTRASGKHSVQGLLEDRREGQCTDPFDALEMDPFDPDAKEGNASPKPR